MTIKEFLQDIRKNKIRIEIIRRQIREIEETVGYKSPALNDIGGGHVLDPFKEQKLIEKKLDLKIDLIKRKTIYLEDMEKATGMILGMGNCKEMDVLQRRYIEGKRWEDIAEGMDITSQWVHVLHNRGLAHLSRDYPQYR